MDAAPLAALDLPLKVLIWADGDQTKVSYLSPSALADRYALHPDLAHNLAGIDPLDPRARLPIGTRPPERRDIGDLADRLQSRDQLHPQ